MPAENTVEDLSAQIIDNDSKLCIACSDIYIYNRFVQQSTFLIAYLFS